MVATLNPQGKTHDMSLYVGTGSYIGALPNIPALSLAGSAPATNEGFLGQEAEDASVHVQSRTVSFATVYDSAAFSTLVNTLLPSNRGSSRDNPALAVICNVTPKSWYVIPVDYMRPGLDTDQSRAIMRPWSMTQRCLLYTSPSPRDS